MKSKSLYLIFINVHELLYVLTESSLAISDVKWLKETNVLGIIYVPIIRNLM